MPTQILVADDNDDLRRMVANILAEEGYQVTQAKNGREVLKQITRAGPCDLLITDISMPDMDGLELVQTLRKSYPDLSIVAISGSFDGQFLPVAKRFGVKDTLQKPFNRAALLKLVESALVKDTGAP